MLTNVLEVLLMVYIVIGVLIALIFMIVVGASQREEHLKGIEPRATITELLLAFLGCIMLGVIWPIFIIYLITERKKR